MKNIQLDQLCRVSYLDNTLFKPSKIYSNPTMRRFWWWDLLPQSQKFSWQCKVLYYCYFIWRPMLFVEKFQSRWSRCNFLFDSQDWVTSKIVRPFAPFAVTPSDEPSLRFIYQTSSSLHFTVLNGLNIYQRIWSISNFLLISKN